MKTLKEGSINYRGGLEEFGFPVNALVLDDFDEIYDEDMIDEIENEIGDLNDHLQSFEVSIRHGYNDGIELSVDYKADSYEDESTNENDIRDIKQILRWAKEFGFKADTPGWVSSARDIDPKLFENKKIFDKILKN